MTYGITILNQDGRIQIDETYSSFYLVSETPTSVAVNTSYPPAGTLSSDLIVAKPAVNGDRVCVFVGCQINTATSSWGRINGGIYTEKVAITPTPTTNGYKYYTLRKTNGNKTPPTGFGLNVYDSVGGLQFAATDSNKVLTLVAVGQITAPAVAQVAQGTTWTTLSDLANVIYYPSSTGVLTNLDKYYCLVNNNDSLAYWSFGANRYIQCTFAYEYIWTGPNEGRIKIHNFRKDTIGTTLPTYWGPYGVSPRTYMIFKESP